jgi:hypothetical protein
MTRAVLLAALLSATLAAPADAAPCGRVTDRLGDASAGNLLGVSQASPVTSNVPSDPALDIRSADVATSGSYVTTVVRLAGDVGPVDPAAPGRGYLFSFRSPRYRDQVFTWVRFHPLALPDAVWGVFDATQAGTPRVLGPARLLVDRTGTEVHATILLDADPALRAALGPRGVRLDRLHAETEWDLGDPNGTGATTALAPVADVASTTATYVAGSASCVRPGS